MASRISIAALSLSAALAVVATTDGSFAAGSRCANRAEYSTLKVAAFQQQLMVAALTCQNISEYNRFVVSYRPELMRSDKAMLRFFMKRDGRAAGDRAYNSYKTRLANDSSVASNEDTAAFCSAASELFAALDEHRQPLADFVWSRPVSDRLPCEYCGNPNEVHTARRFHHGSYESGAQGSDN